MSRKPDIAALMMAAIKEAGSSELPRQYLGGSIIGKECERELWYSFRDGAPPDEFDGRMYRLFEHGHHEESRLVADLRRAGFTVHAADKDGKQFGWEDVDGHFRGHIDGVVKIGEDWHLLECKTHGENSFEKLKKDGLVKSKPEHHSQMQVYMYNMKLKFGLYLAMNKNTDELYTEYVKLEEACAKALISRADSIIHAKTDVDGSPGWKCSWCAFKQICAKHNKERDDKLPAVNVARKTCRQCVYAKIDGREWRCSKLNVPLSREAQLKACDEHVFLPDFVAGAVPDEFNSDGMAYLKPDGSSFLNGKGGFSSDAMMFYPISKLGDENAETLLSDAFGSQAYKRVKASEVSMDEVAPF